PRRGDRGSGSGRGLSQSHVAISDQRSAVGCRLSAPGRLAADVDGFESRVAPVHDEDAEALLHPRLDVAGVRRIAARDLELLARGEHLLNRVLVRAGVDDALAG